MSDSNNNQNENLSQTPLSKRAEILGDLWIRYKNDPDFSDFVTYNDLGLPLAYCLAFDVIESTPKVEMFINETFDVLLAGFDMADIGFDSLDSILDGEVPDMGLLEGEDE